MKSYTLSETHRPAESMRVRFHISAWLLWTVALLLVFCALGAAGAWFYLMSGSTSSAATTDWPDAFPEPDTANMTPAQMDKRLAVLIQRNKRLEKEIEKLHPRDIHIVIDTAHNKLYLKKDDQVLREAVCSTGKGTILEDPQKNRRWVFDTPRGEYRVQGKVTSPVWRKPDWAFIEEGLPVPRREEDRYESGVLGDYGLAFGDGFFIHGTLYTYYIGRSVTHGCVRLKDDDLEFVFKNTPLFAKIYIF